MVVARFFLIAWFAGAAHASGIQVDVIPNFVGAGVGVTTEWMGAKDKVAGIVPGGRVALEEGIPDNVISDLQKMEHPVYPVSGYDRSLFGRGQVILRDAETGVLVAGSDPRADGCAMTL